MGLEYLGAGAPNIPSDDLDGVPARTLRLAAVRMGATLGFIAALIVVALACSKPSPFRPRPSTRPRSAWRGPLLRSDSRQETKEPGKFDSRCRAAGRAGPGSSLFQSFVDGSVSGRRSR